MYMRSVSFWGIFTSGSRIRASQSDLLKLPNLVQTGTREQLVTRLETHLDNSPSGVVTVTNTSSINPLPQEELAQIISSLIDENLAA